MMFAERYPAPSRGLIVVWGLLAAYPFGGMTWQALQYVVGLRRLGFDVWYVEDSDRYLLDTDEFSRTREHAKNVAYLSRHMDAVGLGDRWCFRPPKSTDVLGHRDAAGLRQLYRDADAVINLCGAQELLPSHEGIRRLVYLQTDPVADQVAVANGDDEKIAELDAYDYRFTYGENLGADDCPVPMVRHTWLPTRPPVLVDWWDGAAPPGEGVALTSVLKWHHNTKDVTWQGVTWRWSKHCEFERFVDVAERAALPLELAVSSIGADQVEELRTRGWRVVPSELAADPHAYRSYIRSSLGEFTAAKEQYVRTRSGWFSDRSVCYLAAGRPVITQETGFSKYVPSGEGLLSFETIDQATDAIASVAGDYGLHARRAGEIAGEYFGAERVLGSMMDRISEITR